MNILLKRAVRSQRFDTICEDGGTCDVMMYTFSSPSSEGFLAVGGGGLGVINKSFQSPDCEKSQCLSRVSPALTRGCDVLSATVT